MHIWEGKLEERFCAAISKHSKIQTLALPSSRSLSISPTAVLESRDGYWGRTALHFAAKYEHVDVVRLLPEKGANA